MVSEKRELHNLATSYNLCNQVCDHNHEHTYVSLKSTVAEAASLILSGQ